MVVVAAAEVMAVGVVEAEVVGAAGAEAPERFATIPGHEFICAGVVAGGFPSLPHPVNPPIVAAMILPEQPVTLSAQQVAELNQKLSAMRHDINNSLALVLAGVELMKVKPDTTPRMLGTIAEQPARITGLMRQFCVEFEETMGIKRPEKVH